MHQQKTLFRFHERVKTVSESHVGPFTVSVQTSVNRLSRVCDIVV